MLFTELVRVTVLAAAAIATMLATITVASLDPAEDGVLVGVAIAWWVLAAFTGLLIGRRPQTGAGSALSKLLADARTEYALPQSGPAQIAVGRLWPVLVFGLVTGIAGLFLPQIAAVGAGYALLWALSWRRREPAVAAIEDRDGVRYYVRPSAAWEPLELVRIPGLGNERRATIGDSPIPRT